MLTAQGLVGNNLSNVGGAGVVAINTTLPLNPCNDAFDSIIQYSETNNNDPAGFLLGGANCPTGPTGVAGCPSACQADINLVRPWSHALCLFPCSRISLAANPLIAPAFPFPCASDHQQLCGCHDRVLGRQRPARRAFAAGRGSGGDCQRQLRIPAGGEWHRHRDPGRQRSRQRHCSEPPLQPGEPSYHPTM